MRLLTAKGYRNVNEYSGGIATWLGAERALDTGSRRSIEPENRSPLQRTEPPPA